MHPPKPTRSNVCTSQRRVHPQKKRDEKTKGKRRSTGWRRLQSSACCRIYIPCLATISIGQDRKYTIEGSSATDKDYPIKTKMVNKLINIYLTRSTGQRWRVKIRMKRMSVCVVLYCSISGLGGNNDAFLLQDKFS